MPRRPAPNEQPKITEAVSSEFMDCDGVGRGEGGRLGLCNRS
jgi:hypothetical protein